MLGWTLSRADPFAQEIKKSRFLAQAAHAPNITAALQFIDSAADADARHNCWAYRIGSEYRWFDADEPAGTAGKPVLAAIDGQHLDQVVVIVTRWFGGIKLGAGGLVRAYGGTAAECLRRAQRIPLLQMQRIRIRLAFDLIGHAHNLIELHHASKQNEQFDVDGVQLEVDIETSRLQDFVQALRDAARGEIIIDLDCAAGA